MVDINLTTDNMPKPPEGTAWVLDVNWQFNGLDSHHAPTYVVNSSDPYVLSLEKGGNLLRERRTLTSTLVPMTEASTEDIVTLAHNLLDSCMARQPSKSPTLRL